MTRRMKLPLLFLLVALAPVAKADCMGPYPPSMVKAFNQSCAQDPNVLPFCNCIMDGVQKSIPLADFIETSNSPTGINNDPRFVSATKECSSLLPGSPASKAAAAPANNAPNQPAALKSTTFGR
jgi:hypothetical protein